MISTLDAFGTGNGANRIQIHMMMVRYCIVLTLFRPFGKLHVACFLGSNGPQVRVATFRCFVTGIFETFVAADSKEM